ncbi:MAG: hypothetical protein NTU43_12870 [Bacteroidetes bacterium]|nr:hypothetical protein [Bacteroidota bacterium]
MKTKQINLNLIFAIIFFTLQSCEVLLDQATDRMVDNHINGVIKISESSMFKKDTVVENTKKILTISGKLAFTKGPQGAVYGSLKGRVLRFEIYNENHKVMNNLIIALPILNSSIDPEGLEVNKLYDFRVNIPLPINQWEAVKDYKFLGMY